MTGRARGWLRTHWRTVAVGVLTVALLLVLLPIIAHVHPGLVGADQSYVVQSGSMEPAIPTGSVIFVESDVTAEEITEGDVISFRKGPGTHTTTHRVHEKHTAEVNGTTSMRFTTKGDANESPDAEPVYRDDIVGRMTFHVPYVGLVVALAGTNLGWFVLVVVPVVLLLIDGLWTLAKAVEVE